MTCWMAWNAVAVIYVCASPGGRRPVAVKDWFL